MRHSRIAPLAGRPDQAPARTAWIAAWIALAGIAGCTVRPPFSSEERMVDSVPLAPEHVQGAVAAPFCLHLRYANKFFVAYSDSRTEAWVSQGRCGESGAERAVEGLRVSWWNDGYDTQTNRQCLHAEYCGMNEHNVVEGRNIRCASAQARDGNQTAFISTDLSRCH